MTSTASTPAANGSTGNSNPATQNPSGPKPSLRTNPSLKGPGDSRKPSGGPGDGGQRRNNPQKAWTQGTNPITQKPSFPQQNGSNQQQQKPTPVSKTMASKESNTPDLHAHDRLLFLLTSFIGLTTTIITKSGESFTGVFSGSVLESSESSFMMKMTQRASDQSRANGTNEIYLGSAPDHSMVFDVKDIIDVAVANVSTADVIAKEPGGGSNGFRTDADISGRQATRERNLQRWEPGPETEVDLSLESAGSAGWDQFEANARLFGATSSYDENLYTTRIDRSDPSYKRKEAEAARIAREIESSDTDNVHLKEERGHVGENDGGHDEEEKYSGVRRDESQFPPLQSGQPNKYTPPARRPPTSQPTVPGAPVDPAIISAQIARPDASSKSTQPKINVVPSQNADSQQEKQAQTTKPAPTGKPVVDSEQKLTPGKPSLTTTVSPERTGGVENASANVETEVLDHFRQFANNEKLKIQERRRHQATQDRTIKLNELMKFSKNFKLGTPVPKDLVPILAKDPGKQEKIIEKTQRQHVDKKPSPPATASNAAPASAEQKPANRGPGAGRYDGMNTAPMAGPPDRQNFNRGRPGYPSPAGPQFGHGGRMDRSGQQAIQSARAGPGMLSHRLAGIQQERKGVMGPTPAPLPIPETRVPPSGPVGDHAGVSSPHKGTASQTPTSAVSTKFNVKALEFKPNPAASTFTPGGASVMSASPKSGPRTRSVSRAPSPSIFFGSKKPVPASERPSINDHFNPIKRMKKECAEQQTEKHYSFNGGIPPAYRTIPTWDVPAAMQDKEYKDLFQTPAVPPPISQNRSVSNPPMPHQHQLPFHLQQGQNMPPASGPPHGPQHLQPPQPTQHHPGPGPPHLEEHHHRMQMSASTSQVFPSPRLQQSHASYNSPIGHHAQLAYNQPMPPFYVGQGGPQPNHGRPYPAGPQFVPQNGMGAPMMVQNPSNGPYMGVPQGMPAPYNPQMHMYSPNAGHAYPQHAGPPPQPHSGYPSPSRGAPMMMHQGSQQGQPSQPVMFMNPPGQGGYGQQQQQPNHMRGGYPPQQPHFSSSPHQTHHYPPHQHQHRAASNNYNQMPQVPPSNLPPQPPAAAAGPHPPESGDEVK